MAVLIITHKYMESAMRDRRSLTDLKKIRFNPYATVNDDEKVERFHYDHLSVQWYYEYDRGGH
jgi:hypothetical protein